MAKQNRRRTGSARSRGGWRPRLAALALLLVLAGAAWGWWSLRHWQPARGLYPIQGVEMGAGDGVVDWTAIHAIDANFAYVETSAGAFARDPAAERNLEGARAAGLKVGAVHRYDPCQPADRQAANFVTVVPRDARMLPPAIALEDLADSCPVAVSDAAVLSELMTFINEIETHTGKPAILAIGPDFEARYHLSGRINRELWLRRDRLRPSYAGRPFTLWTANSALMTSAGDAPLRWVVAQP